MATIIKCDKCGKEIKQINDAYDIMVGQNCLRVDRFDICSDCYKKIISTFSVYWDREGRPKNEDDTGRS